MDFQNTKIQPITSPKHLQMENKLKLSEIIKTDCYIDCGSNEKLREVVCLIESKYNIQGRLKDIYIKGCTFISLYEECAYYICTQHGFNGIPIYHISNIDLKA
jgi:hypothetical protein